MKSLNSTRFGRFTVSKMRDGYRLAWIESGKSIVMFSADFTRIVGMINRLNRESI